MALLKRKNITLGEHWEQSAKIGLWDWQITAYCFYLHFTQRPNWTRIGVVHEQYIEGKVSTLDILTEQKYRTTST